MEKERGRKGELILPIRGVNVVCRLYSTAIIPFRARCIGSMGRKFLRAEEDTTDLRVSYSIHAPGQLFLFRSDFRATLPLSFLVACTRIPEIRFYPEIGLENGACGKQFPVKTLNARVSSNFVNHTWRERERERVNIWLVGSWIWESCKYLNVECSIPRGISPHTLVDRCRSARETWRLNGSENAISRFDGSSRVEYNRNRETRNVEKFLFFTRSKERRIGQTRRSTGRIFRNRNYFHLRSSVLEIIQAEVGSRETRNSQNVREETRNNCAQQQQQQHQQTANTVLVTAR